MILDPPSGIPHGLAGFSRTIAVGGCDQGRLASNLFRSKSLDDALTQFGAAFPQADRRALMSAWSMYYFCALIIPATAALIRLDRALPVALDDDIVIDLGGDGRAKGFWLQHNGTRASERPEDVLRFDPLIRGHLGPMIARCSQYSGLSPRVLWNNAGVVLDFAVSEIIQAGTATSERMLAEAKALLEGATPSELARPYIDPDLAERRRRRVCCLRYRLPGHGICAGVCPLLSTATANRAVAPKTSGVM